MLEVWFERYPVQLDDNIIEGCGTLPSYCQKDHYGGCGCVLFDMCCAVCKGFLKLELCWKKLWWRESRLCSVEGYCMSYYSACADDNNSSVCVVWCSVI